MLSVVRRWKESENDSDADVNRAGERAMGLADRFGNEPAQNLSELASKLDLLHDVDETAIDQDYPSSLLESANADVRRLARNWPM